MVTQAAFIAFLAGAATAQTPLQFKDANALTGNLAAPIGNQDESPRPRVQGGLPRELILPPPSDMAIAQAKRFVQAEINPELPLSLALGRPKILQLADAPLRIFMPEGGVASAEILDAKSGRELAITRLVVGSTTLSLWFRDPTSQTGQTIVSYLVRVYADPFKTRSLDELELELNQLFPNSFVELDEIDGRLLVRGQERDAIEMASILQNLRGHTISFPRPFSG